jgi:hypothetical protein
MAWSRASAGRRSTISTTPGIDDQNQLYLDEPWSRPGDYVLMRALTDLVCVSSACPDDIDPANGWDPTDIHVRTYSDKQRFSRAVAYRMTPDAEPQLTRETAFHERFSKLTRNFAEYRGYWLPTHFNDGADRRILGLPRGGRRHGPVAAAQVRGHRARCGSAAAILPDPRHAAAVAGPGRLYRHVLRARRHDRRRHGVRLAQDNFRWIGGDDYSGIWLREQADKLGSRPGCAPRPTRCTISPCRGRTAATSSRRSSGRRRPGPGSRNWDGSASPSGASAPSRAAGGGVAHRLHGRTRLRDLLSSEGRSRGVRRGVGGGPAARPQSPGPEALDMVRIEAGLSSPTTSSPTRPIRSKPASASPCRSSTKVRRLHRQGRLDRAQGPSAAQARRPGNGRQRSSRPRRLRACRHAPRSAS